MRHHFILSLLLLAILPACQSGTTAPIAPIAPNPCADGSAALRRHSCVAVKPAGRPLSVLFAWADDVNTWKADEDGIARVSVQFFDGSQWSRDQVWKRMQVIDDLAAGLAFRLADHGEVGDIRVSFRCSGHWSYLGRTALRIPESQATLNVELDRGNDTREWDRVVLHEVLHAVGFEHEHQHPQAQIPWNREAVYEFYGRTQGWSREQIDFQVLNRGEPKRLRTSGVDDASIMQYPVPRELTTNGYSVGWNTRMTASDVTLLRDLYPAP
jgi:hypothetical protein